MWQRGPSYFATERNSTSRDSVGVSTLKASYLLMSPMRSGSTDLAGGESDAEVDERVALDLTVGFFAGAELADGAHFACNPRGFRWETRGAENGRCRNEHVAPRYVRDLMPPAFLSPKVIEALMEGHQPAELASISLARRIDIPVLWRAQQQVLGPALPPAGSKNTRPFADAT